VPDDDRIVPAATVVLLRDGPDGPETLMLRRNRRLVFAGGHWVFPGGRMEAADLDAPALPALDDAEAARRADDPALLAAARRAAVRETAEETGLVLDADGLSWIAHWMPPRSGQTRRFATWFFAATAPEGAVVVDGGEIHDHAWLRPADTLERRDAGTVELSPPTWVTLWQLRPYASAADALAALASRPAPRFATRIVAARDPAAGSEGDADHLVALWHGDAGYDDGDPTRAGARHRLEMRTGAWRYHRDPAPVDPDVAVP
jgi:8-oxo-dGTP pyrophosphatase MutT (NUDIX family)